MNANTILKPACGKLSLFLLVLTVTLLTSCVHHQPAASQSSAATSRNPDDSSLSADLAKEESCQKMGDPYYNIMGSRPWWLIYYPKTSQPSVVKTRSLDDFNLSAYLTEAEVRQRMGDPDDIAGSGVRWLVYHLKTGEDLLLLFDPYNAYGGLWAADLVSPDHQERRPVFDKNSH